MCVADDPTVREVKAPLAGCNAHTPKALHVRCQAVKVTMQAIPSLDHVPREQQASRQHGPLCVQVVQAQD